MFFWIGNTVYTCLGLADLGSTIVYLLTVPICNGGVYFLLVVSFMAPFLVIIGIAVKVSKTETDSLGARLKFIIKTFMFACTGNIHIFTMETYSTLESDMHRYINGAIFGILMNFP